MDNDQAITSKKNVFLLLRLVLGIVLTSLCMIQLFVTFRGLDQAAAMDQAQIGRQIARGEGFTTKYFTPYDLVTRNKISKTALDFSNIKATNHAPLYPLVLSAAIRMTGYHQFDAKRMKDEGEMVYDGDRVIAGVSTFFFLLSLLLSYVLFRKMFDEILAATVVTLMGFSELLLQYAVSGLAQPMMACLFLGIVIFLVKAIEAQEADRVKGVVLYNIIALVLAVLLCLTCRISIWCSLGLLIFCGFYFRPRGLFALIGVVMGLLFVLLPNLMTLQSSGGMGHAFQQAFYGGFGSGGLDHLLRSTDAFGINFDASNFFLRLLGYTFAQTDSMYVNMGSIIVTPFFLLALFNRYRNPIVNGVKWVVFSCWLCSCAGMALFGESTAISPSQLSILFTPFFAAYGLSLVFIFLARLQLADGFIAVRNLAIVAIILISCGMFFFQFPQQLYYGFATSARGIPHFPPYFPPKLNVEFHNITNADDIVVTDQPWAVAWYADRKALWMPRTISHYTEVIEPMLTRSKQGVQGFLITPSSHTMPERGISGVIAEAGEFAPLALEGKLLQLVPGHNMALAELFNSHGDRQASSRPLGSLVSSRGQFPHRKFLLGAEMVYYSSKPTN